MQRRRFASGTQIIVIQRRTSPVIQVARAAVISVILCRRALVSGVGVQLKQLGSVMPSNGTQTAFDAAVIFHPTSNAVTSRKL